jgi:hypothetical protein
MKRKLNLRHLLPLLQRSNNNKRNHNNNKNRMLDQNGRHRVKHLEPLLSKAKEKN